MKSGSYTLSKRLLDILISSLVFLFLWWFFLLIMFLYIPYYNSPVFYISKRIGKDGKFFLMYKYRTLTIYEQLPIKQRQFWLGKLLRATNLDELPQLWNVLRGEMSLVGPRPLPIEYAGLFSNDQNIRHTVLPGITGLAQVSGKNDLTWNEKFKFDLEYVNQISLALDLRILLKTFIVLISFRKDNSLIEKKFTG
jgi:undecaprenyl phosphate N,N'-diacetylbacillosamine 1-phosphate transferase